MPARIQMLPTHVEGNPARPQFRRLGWWMTCLSSRSGAKWIILTCFSFLAILALLGPSHLPPEHPLRFDSYGHFFPGHGRPDEVLVPPPVPRPRPPPGPIPGKPLEEMALWERRREEVRQAYLHAYRGYMSRAYPHDELLSVSGRHSDKFNGWAVTMIDSMDTMWTMGLKAEFDEAVSAVAAQNFTQKPHEYAPFFETVIRYLGGLLSAYALSNEPILLTRADDLGRLLLPVFDANIAHFPGFSINTDSGKVGMGWSGDSVLFAEIATCQLEYKYLAKMTGRKEYYDAVENVMTKLYEANPADGLFAIKWGPAGQPRDKHYSVGASADSGYEYMLKQWIQSGDLKARDQYIKSMEGVINNLFYVTPNRKLLYATDVNSGIISHSLEHLSCFMAGTLTLGVHLLPDLPLKTKELHQWAAEGLAYTCYVSYADQQTGLGPDKMEMKPGEKWVDALKKWEEEGKPGKPPGLEENGKKTNSQDRDYWAGNPSYQLRPETVESLFMLWKTTGDEKWRERGYEIFKAIETATKTEFGYSSIYFIDGPTVRHTDDMPSWFLAETLKYLYLLFDDTEPYPLDKWVFNTEAHPLPVFAWTEAERKVFKI